MMVDHSPLLSAISFCFRVRCHIVHLSSAKSLKLIQEARQAGAPLTVETTHHYLSLCAEHIPVGGTQFKCCPPIRGFNNQVWKLTILIEAQLKTGLLSFYYTLIISRLLTVAPTIPRSSCGQH